MDDTRRNIRCAFWRFYSRSQVYTMPEFLEKRYGPHSRTVLSLISLVSYVLTKVAVTVFAGGIVFKTVLEIDFLQIGDYQIDFFWVGAIGLVVITGLYTVVGGMKSVLYTSVLQTPVLFISSLVIVFIGLKELGGWGQLEVICREEVTVHGDSMMSLMRSSQDPDFPWAGVIFGVAIIGFWYWCTDQYIVQRVLSGRNQQQARRGAIFGSYLKLFPVFLFLVPGMIAFAMNKKGLITLDDPDGAFPTLVRDVLPVGIKGLVVGGLLAALMSSLASLFNSSAMLFTVDFYKKYRPQASEKQLVFVGRIATVTVVLLGILWIPVMKGMGEVLFVYLQQVQAFLAPGIAAVFVMGVFWKGTTSAAGFTGLIVGFIVGMFRLVLSVFKDKLAEGTLLYHFNAINWLYFCIYLFLVCVVVILVVSLFTKKPRIEQLQGLTYGSATAKQKTQTRNSWNKWDIIHSAIILGIIVVFYWYFW